MRYEVRKTAEGFDYVPPSFALFDNETNEVIALIEAVDFDEWLVNIPDVGTGKTVEAFDHFEDASTWALKNIDRIREHARRVLH